MKASAEQKKISIKDVTITENPELGRIFGDRVLFPEKSEVAKEHICKYGLPKYIPVPK